MKYIPKNNKYMYVNRLYKLMEKLWKDVAVVRVKPWTDDRLKMWRTNNTAEKKGTDSYSYGLTFLWKFMII